MLQALKALGWKSSDADNKADTLTSTYASYFSADKLSKRIKCFFQCLYFIADLFGKGLTELRQSQPAGYYMSILHSDDPKSVPFGAKKDVYEELVEHTVAKEMRQRVQRAVGCDDAVMSDFEPSPLDGSEPDEKKI